MSPQSPEECDISASVSSQSSIAKLSVIIPAHNEANYLPGTIEALQRAIAETGITAEIIVVDDASTDRTLEIANELGCKTATVELRNIGAVRNAGAALAQYDWLLFVDADTIVPPATLFETIDALENGCVGGGARVDISDEKRVPFPKYCIYLTAVFVWQILGRWAAGCYMFCRRESFEDFQGFREEYFAAEELFFSRELKARGKFKLVREPVVTSARKLHGYSTWQLLRFVFRPMLAGRRMLQSRAGLDLLYRDNR